MNLKLSALVALAPVAFAATAAAAADHGIVILPGASQSITLSNGVTTNAYNNPVGNTGAGTITGDRPLGAAGTTGANGSLKLTGDRSRYVIGSEFDAPALFRLDDLSSLSFQYRVDNNGSPNNYNTPVIRVHVIDPGDPSGSKARSTLTWEGTYNGVTNDEGLGWKSGDFGGDLFINVASGASRTIFVDRNPGYTIDGSGVLMQNNAQVEGSLSGLNGLYSQNAYVTGLSFGAGSGFGSDFVGYVDNVRFNVAGNTNIVNFEASPTAAVPEPATWAMLILGFGLVGAAARRRRSLVTA